MRVGSSYRTGPKTLVVRNTTRKRQGKSGTTKSILFAEDPQRMVAWMRVLWVKLVSELVVESHSFS